MVRAVIKPGFATLTTFERGTAECYFRALGLCDVVRFSFLGKLFTVLLAAIAALFFEGIYRLWIGSMLNLLNIAPYF